jgi:hypothetical protein
LREEQQFTFGKGELREAAIQTDHKPRGYEDSRRVQNLTCVKMNVDLRANLVLIVGSASKASP